MATRFYLHNDAAPYTPATFKGAWDSTASAVTKRIDASPFPATARAYTQIGTSGTAPVDVCHYRGVSGPLAAGTIGTGTFNLAVGTYETSATADCYWHVHIWVTQGDSDSVRGTLLSDYTENTTNEWANSQNEGRSLQSGQSLSSVTVSAGDRIVVELGVVRRGATAADARLHYGHRAYSRDLLAGDECYTAPVSGWVEFSETLTGTATNRITQEAVETALTETTTSSRVTQESVEVSVDEDVTPSARVSQQATEVVILSDNDPQRVTQVVGELVSAQTSAMRTTQVVAEVVAPSVVTSRLTQVVAELLFPTIVQTSLTQAVAEVLDAAPRELRVSQIVVELLGKSSSYCGPPTLSPSPLCGKSDVLAWLEWAVPMREN